MDALIEDLLKLHDQRHKKAEYTDDMPKLAERIAGGYQIAEHSFVTAEGIVNVSPEGGLRQRRGRAAHEISHAITKQEDEEGGSYEKAIRYHHYSVGDMEAHLEALADAGGDLLLMPDHQVRFALQEYGYTGQAIWELSATAEVGHGDALRRIVQFDQEARIGGLVIGSDGRVLHVAWQGMHLPHWPEEEAPDLDYLRAKGMSVFEVPDRPGCYICLKKVDDFEAA
jgi:hypothetical protein